MKIIDLSFNVEPNLSEPMSIKIKTRPHSGGSKFGRKIVNQLGFESISLVELASVLSKETGVKVTHNQAIKWTTVKSILSTLAATSKDNNA